MFRKLRVWWIIITGTGSVRKLVAQVDEFFRFHVLNSLKQEGVFDYLSEPRTYGEILSSFDYVDSEFAHLLLDGLASDKRNVITKKDNRYVINPEHELPALEEIMASTAGDNQLFSAMAEGMVAGIPLRLRRQPVELSESFEADGRTLLTKFNTTLGHRVYGTLRKAAYALLTAEEREWLKGKTLLDIGCGSGRETAELWVLTAGQTRITAIEPVKLMMRQAERDFESLVADVDPNHPPITADNRPVYKNVSATDLPFEDDSFDAVFYSQILHWTPDPARAIREISRVLKPGGLFFGSQICKPNSNPYMDIVVRTSENSHGFFWEEELERWYANSGLAPETVTPIGVFRGRQRERK